MSESALIRDINIQQTFETIIKHLAHPDCSMTSFYVPCRCPLLPCHFLSFPQYASSNSHAL